MQPPEAGLGASNRGLDEFEPSFQAQPGGEFIVGQVGRAGFIHHGLGGDQADGPARAAGRHVTLVHQAVHREGLVITGRQVFLAVMGQGQGGPEEAQFPETGLNPAQQFRRGNLQ